MILDLLARQIIENRRKLKTTVLYRKDGAWHQAEVIKLVIGLMTEASGHPKHPEYLILFGHYTKEETLKAICGGQAYIVSQITGIEELPFVPGFI